MHSAQVCRVRSSKMVKYAAKPDKDEKGKLLLLSFSLPYLCVYVCISIQSAMFTKKEQAPEWPKVRKT